MDMQLKKVKRLTALFLRIAVASVIIAVIIVKFKELINLDVAQILAEAGGKLSAAMVILGVYLLKSVLFVIPASIIYTAVCLVFSPWEAVLLNAAGILLEVIATYFLGRLLGGQYVVKFLQGKKAGSRILALKDKQKNGAIFIVRALPVFPIDFVSLFLGASHMGFLPYLLVSFGGIMPRVILFTLLGKSIFEIFPMKAIIVFVLVAVMLGLALWVARNALAARRGMLADAGRRYEPLSKCRRTVILDTDIGPDCDDAGAIALLLKESERLGFDVAGIVNCTSNKFGNGAIRAITSFCGASVKIAQFEGDGFFEHNEKYNKAICEKYLEGVPNAVKAEQALNFYKDVLEGAKDGSVVIVTIGMLNNISRLIEEYPELAAAKVHAIVSMAGAFPNGDREFNIVSAEEEARKVFESFPNSIVCCGYEVGEKVLTGYTEPPLNCDKNPIYDAYRLYVDGKDGAQLRPSWDLTAVQFAAEGEGGFYKLSKSGRITVAQGGKTEFTEEKGANRYYIIKKARSKDIADYLNSLIREYDEPGSR